MAPSPQQSMPPTAFKQTWDETDAVFLDPASLPIARMPRGWERKQETKVTAKGKQKKIWRRYTTRTQAADATPEEDEDEVHDSRARAVKKQQRMSPEAIEKSALMRHGKTRAFKATRWDRRRSVLPRKKRATVEITLGGAQDANGSSDEAQDAEDADISNNNFSDVDMSGMGDAAPMRNLVPENDDRRVTFTFPIEENQHDFCGHEMAYLPTTDDLSIDTLEPQGEQDAAPTQLLRSPTKNVSLLDRHQSVENVEYPELPQSLEAEAESTADPEEVQQVDLQSGTVAVDGIVEVVVTQAVNEDTSFEHKESPSIEGEKGVHHEAELTLETTSVEVTEVSYPSLPAEVPTDGSVGVAASPEHQNLNETVTDFDVLETQPEDGDNDVVPDGHDDSSHEEFTEASLQLNIQQEMEMELQRKQPEAEDTPEEQQDSVANSTQVSEDIAMSGEVADISCQEILDAENYEIVEPITTKTENLMDDITAGLTLGFSVSSSREPTPRKLRSPSPPPNEQGPDDATVTIAVDEDTAILKDFLSRAAASKANKTTNIARRESLHNRRDSDVIRHALASPRKMLEDKDPNSPSKYDNEVTLDLSQTLTLTPDLQAPASPSEKQADIEGAEDFKTSRSRRSSRTRKSRLPAPPSVQPAGPPKIAVRRADGGEPIVLKKSDAQELSLLTRANTRKNKQGSVAVNIRLLKLALDAAGRSEDSTIEAVQVPGKKCVRWDEQLAYYQEGTDTMANMLADAESLATPDELSLPAPPSTPRAKSKSKVPKDKNTTPKIRRVRGLGTTNGTPGKGLLQPGSLLPEAVQEENEAAQTQAQHRLPKPKSSKLKKMPVASTSTATSASFSTPAPSESKLPTLDVAPVGVEPIKPSSSTTTTKERKSRLATPKKVKLPQPIPTVPVEGQENQQRISLAAATPKKGISVPPGIVPPPSAGTGGGAETALPRRRARKL